MACYNGISSSNSNSIIDLVDEDEEDLLRSSSPQPAMKSCPACTFLNHILLSNCEACNCELDEFNPAVYSFFDDVSHPHQQKLVSTFAGGGRGGGGHTDEYGSATIGSKRFSAKNGDPVVNLGLHVSNSNQEEEEKEKEKEKDDDNFEVEVGGGKYDNNGRNPQVGDLVKLAPGYDLGHLQFHPIGEVVEVDGSERSVLVKARRKTDVDFFWYKADEIVKVVPSSSSSTSSTSSSSSDLIKRARKYDNSYSNNFSYDNSYLDKSAQDTFEIEQMKLIFNSDFVTYGIVPALRTRLLEIDPSNTNFKLCSDSFPHISQKSDHVAAASFIPDLSPPTSSSSASVAAVSASKPDMGWSCGYRNIQMMCVGLMTQESYRKVLFGGSGEVPDIYLMQEWIEKAWNQGFDPSGAAQMGYPEISLRNSRDWIGACECATLLRLFGIRAVVVDFDLGKGDNIYDLSGRLEAWLRRYYSAYENYNIRSSSSSGGSRSSSSSLTSSNGCDNFIPILYAQQSGHSRSIIGFECTSSSTAQTVVGKIASETKSTTLDRFGFSTSSAKSTAITTATTTLTTTTAAIVSNKSGSKHTTTWHIHPMQIADAERKAKTVCDICDCSAKDHVDVTYCCKKCDVDICINCFGTEKSTASNTDKFNMLVFDPAHNGKVILDSLQNNTSQWKSSLKRGLHTFRNRRQYQLVYVRPGIMSSQERIYSKDIDGMADTADIVL